MEVKVHMGFLFPSRTPSLRMNQLNNIQTPKSKATRADPLRRHRLPPHQPARQSKRCELSAAFPPIRAPMPAAGSSILRFTGLLLDACSYSNTRTQLSMSPRCRARLHRLLPALGSLSGRESEQTSSRRGWAARGWARRAESQSRCCHRNAARAGTSRCSTDHQVIIYFKEYELGRRLYDSPRQWRRTELCKDGCKLSHTET